MLTKKNILLFVCVMSVFWGVHARAAENTTKDGGKARVINAFATVHTLAFGVVKSPVSNEGKNALLRVAKAAQIEKASSEQTYASVALEGDKVIIILGTYEDSTPYLCLYHKSSKSQDFFSIDDGSLAEFVLLAEEIFNEGLVQGKTTLNDIINTLKFVGAITSKDRVTKKSVDQLNLLKNYNGKPLSLSKDIQAMLVNLLKVQDWKMTSDDNFIRGNDLNIMLLSSDNMQSDYIMEFRISDGPYFVEIKPKSQEFGNALFEVPRQAFMNLGLIDQ